jgi:anaerobic nitric oxide reductase transcription regulator
MDSKQLDAILAIALDLTSSLTARDRYRRLLETVRRVIPCDAASLLRLEGEELVPVAAHGLVPEAFARRYPRGEHPRLDVICNADDVVLFPPDSALPDPFDGALAGEPSALGHIHACLGCALRVDGELVGALTADALTPGAFDGLDRKFLSSLGALAGAAMRTSRLIEALGENNARLDLVAKHLVRDAQREGELLGTSPPMQRLRDDIAVVAHSDLSVLITGETGVGKELVARDLHAQSRRADRPLLYVNCAALPEPVAESELFGHVRGAFTGASSERPGKFEVADGGTLFLDEIGELPLGMQPKLLRALQHGEIQRVGADRPLHVDVRVIAATNRDLESEVAAGRFRADLFHRLNVFPMRVPPLRERRADIPLLAGFFCDLARRRLGLGPVRLDAEARALLSRYDWPGNVRELENVLSRVALRAAAAAPRGATVVLTPAHFGPELDAASPGPATASPGGAASSLARPGASLRDATEDYQRELIRQTVAAQGGNWAAAARALRVHRSNLHRLAQRLGLQAGPAEPPLSGTNSARRRMR